MPSIKTEKLVSSTALFEGPESFFDICSKINFSPNIVRQACFEGILQDFEKCFKHKYNSQNLTYWNTSGLGTGANSSLIILFGMLTQVSDQNISGFSLRLVNKVLPATKTVKVLGLTYCKSKYYVTELSHL